MPTTNTHDRTIDTSQNHNSSSRKMTFSTASPNQSSPYFNVIEVIVTEEVERQLKKLPPHLVKYINPAQAIAYALNRLPPLYATSEEGWHRQQLRAKNELREQIVKAVRQGLAAVQQDPLKVTTPLKVPGNSAQENNKKSSGQIFRRIRFDTSSPTDA